MLKCWLVDVITKWAEPLEEEDNTQAYFYYKTETGLESENTNVEGKLSFGIGLI